MHSIDNLRVDTEVNVALQDRYYRWGCKVSHIHGIMMQGN